MNLDMVRSGKNHPEWPPMPGIDEYLEARSRAEKISARVSALAKQLARFSDALRLSPHKAVTSVPQDWMTAEELRLLLNDACEAWNQIGARYNQIPDDQRKHVAPPLHGMGVG